MNVTPLPAGTVGSIVVNAGPFLNSGTISGAGGTITAASIAANSIIGNGATTSAVPGALTLGTNFSINSGTLNVLAGGGVGSSLEPPNFQTVAPYTLVAGDLGKLIEASAGSPSVVLHTPNYGAGFWADVFFTGAGLIIPSTGSINNQTTINTPSNAVTRIVFDGTNYVATSPSPWNLNSGGAIVANNNAGPAWIGSLNSLTGSGNLAVGQNITGQNAFSGVFGSSHSLTTGGSGNLVGGSSNKSSGSNGLLVGVAANDWGLNGGRFHGATSNGQGGEFQFAGAGSGTVAIRLVTGPVGYGASSANTGSIPAKSAIAFEILAEAVDVTNGGYATWKGTNSGAPGIIAQTGTATSTTTLASGFAFAAGASLGTFSSIGTFALTADTTNGGFDLTYTPGAGNTGTVHASAKVNWTWAD